jgi:hypothetical protein
MRRFRDVRWMAFLMNRRKVDGGTRTLRIGGFSGDDFRHVHAEWFLPMPTFRTPDPVPRHRSASPRFGHRSRTVFHTVISKERGVVGPLKIYGFLSLIFLLG